MFQRLKPLTGLDSLENLNGEQLIRDWNIGNLQDLKKFPRSRKQPKTLSGIETTPNSDMYSPRPRRKQPKTLSGIETPQRCKLSVDLDVRKQPKTLSGIETISSPKTSQIRRAGNNLKPYQWLKQRSGAGNWDRERRKEGILLLTRDSWLLLS